MNDSSQNNEDYQILPGSKSSQDKEDVFADITGDGIFTVKVSEDMVIRNMLRSALVDAQGKDTDKIPLFVSWPNWLDDGIVCLFAKDLHEILHKTVKDTVISLNKILGMEGLNLESGAPAEERDYEIETESPAPDTLKDEPEAGRDETETIPEQETSEKNDHANTLPVENGENPEEPGKTAPGHDIVTKLFTEIKKENNK